MFRLELPAQALQQLRQNRTIQVAVPWNQIPDLEAGMTLLGLFERPQNAAYPCWLTLQEEIRQCRQSELDENGEASSVFRPDISTQKPESEENPEQVLGVLSLTTQQPLEDMPGG